MTVLAERGASAARSLSYAALAEYSRCGYRFLTERVLGLGSGEASVPGGGGGGELPPGARKPARGSGSGGPCTSCSRRRRSVAGRAPEDAEVAAALLRQDAAPGRAGEAAAMVDAWLGSELLAELREGGARFRPELAFRLGARRRAR